MMFLKSSQKISPKYTIININLRVKRLILRKNGVFVKICSDIEIIRI